MAAAVDITRYWLDSFSQEERLQAERSGRVVLHSDYDAVWALACSTGLNVCLLQQQAGSAAGCCIKHCH